MNDDEQNAAHPECTCRADDYEACIQGVVYGPCDSENCGGVCVSYGMCRCQLHASPTHRPAYGLKEYSACDEHG